MMISPGTYYDEVKETGIDNLQKEIRRLKRLIARQKKEIEDPRSEPETVCPSKSTVIYWSREYLAMAKKALAESGGKYKETKAERAEREFRDSLPRLRRLELGIGGFFDGWEKYALEVDGDTLKRDTVMVIEGMDVSEVETREELLEYLRDMHLEEWRKNYSPERYGACILDGTQWSLTLEYDDWKVREYNGDNVFPWNFEDLCVLFGAEWERF